ncbi:hypothetical protein RB595_003662 [Gaeumannomyces hyphopodioides]
MASRAERFEDEKRRIIESCFARRDEDGSILETYITHIRIVEYSSHPTSPPPPQARSASSEKPRVIIVAVRKSGRVRMHKSKENPNGSFSIGKTWNLDDLSTIESFTGPGITPDYRQWAGDVGFTVTLGKPYYWQAQTDKEKKFFIASLIKIYAKYTGGRTPTLSGFDPQEEDQVVGGLQRRPGQPPLQQFSPQPERQNASGRLPSRSPGPSQGRMPPPPDRSQVPPLGRPPFPERSPMPEQQQPVVVVPGSRGGYGGRDVARDAARGAPDYRGSPPRPQLMGQDGSASPAASFDSTRSANQNALRRLAGSNKSQDSVAASFTARSEDGGSITTTRSREPPPSNGSGRFGGSSSDLTVTRDERPPERKRPPMDPGRPQGYSDDALVPAPLMSSGMRRDREPAVPPRSVARKPSVASRAESRPGTARSEASSLHDRSALDSPGRFDAVPSRSPIPANGSFSKPPTPKPVAVVAPPSPAPPPAAEPSPPPPKTPVEEKATPPEEEERPGLGPMIKKKSKGEIQGVFWKAAAVAGGFKPRAGGAAERLRQAALSVKNSEEPDGITGVVPAPPRPASLEKPQEQSPLSEIPEVTITPSQGSAPSVEIKELEKSAKKEAEQAEEAKKDASRQSVVTGNDVKYLATLGVDPSVLDNRSVEFAKWLDYFGWVPGEQMRSRNFDDLRIDIDRELNRAQAGGWLARFREEDERVDAIKKGIDLSIQECEEMDNLLTLYSVELSTLSEDIAYIEAQGQGLQVQAANQKLLKKELESLLDTCAISQADLDPLRMAPLESTAGLEEIETALVTLFKAMTKIDPTMGSSDSGRKSVDGSGEDASMGLNSDYGKMRMVQEKKDMYTAESAAFMRRLVGFTAGLFEDAHSQVRQAVDGPVSKKVDPRNHDIGRDMLWKYSPLVLYARDMDLENWNRIVQIYQDKCHPVYKDEFRGALDRWKVNSKSVGDDSDLLFTSAVQEKQQEGMVTAARKLTVKRSQTLARTFRGESKVSLAEKPTTSHGQPWEAFQAALDDLVPMVEMEQNFIIDFFHATTLEQLDFPEAVAAARPQDRRGLGDLRRHRLMEPDRELARRVTRAMEVIFAFLEQELQKFIDWVLSSNPIQGVGVLAALERKMAGMGQSNQDFLNSILSKLHATLEGKFKRFVDEQIRAIEDTKVKIKKRKGVIPFIRIFPNFSAAVENMLADSDPTQGARRTVDREYERILRSMFESVKVIARDNPAVSGATTAGGGSSALAADPEDKEALNFHILLIENMNYFLDEVSKMQQNQQQQSEPVEVLEEWKEQAAAELAEHMSLYLNAVMRRPLGRLLEHLENVEAQLANGKAPGAVAGQASNSKGMFNKVLGNYDAKEVRKGLEALRKRVEKHFGDSDDGGGGGLAPGMGGGFSQPQTEHAQGLVNRVLRECERFYNDVEMRISAITTNVYGGDVLFEWPRAEVKAAFSNIGR